MSSTQLSSSLPSWQGRPSRLRRNVRLGMGLGYLLGATLCSASPALVPRATPDGAQLAAYIASGVSMSPVQQAIQPTTTAAPLNDAVTAAPDAQDQCWTQWSSWWAYANTSVVPEISVGPGDGLVSVTQVGQSLSTFRTTYPAGPGLTTTEVSVFEFTSTQEEGGFAQTTLTAKTTSTTKINEPASKESVLVSTVTIPSFSVVSTQANGFGTTKLEKPTCTLPAVVSQCQASWEAFESSYLPGGNGQASNHVAQSPSCTQASITGPLCAQLQTQYLAAWETNWQTFEAFSGQFTDVGYTQVVGANGAETYEWPATSQLAPGCTLGCGGCAITGGSVQLLYWPTTFTASEEHSSGSVTTATGSSVSPTTSAASGQGPTTTGAKPTTSATGSASVSGSASSKASSASGPSSSGSSSVGSSSKASSESGSSSSGSSAKASSAGSSSSGGPSSKVASSVESSVDGSSSKAVSGSSGSGSSAKSPPASTITPTTTTGALVPLQGRSAAAGGPVVATMNGLTFTSPTLYIAFASVYASNSCSGIGATKTKVIVPVTDPAQLSSMWMAYPGPGVRSTASFNVADLNEPVPQSIYNSQLRCAAYTYSAVQASKVAPEDVTCPTNVPYEPILVVPPSLLDAVDSDWSGCAADIRGLYDPPITLGGTGDADGAGGPPGGLSGGGWSILNDFIDQAANGANGARMVKDAVEVPSPKSSGVMDVAVAKDDVVKDPVASTNTPSGTPKGPSAILPSSTNASPTTTNTGFNLNPVMSAQSVASSILSGATSLADSIIGSSDTRTGPVGPLHPISQTSTTAAQSATVPTINPAGPMSETPNAPADPHQQSPTTQPAQQPAPTPQPVSSQPPAPINVPSNPSSVGGIIGSILGGGSSSSVATVNNNPPPPPATTSSAPPANSPPANQPPANPPAQSTSTGGGRVVAPVGGSSSTSSTGSSTGTTIVQPNNGVGNTPPSNPASTPPTGNSPSPSPSTSPFTPPNGGQSVPSNGQSVPNTPTTTIPGSSPLSLPSTSNAQGASAPTSTPSSNVNSPPFGTGSNAPTASPIALSPTPSGASATGPGSNAPGTPTTSSSRQSFTPFTPASLLSQMSSSSYSAFSASRVSVSTTSTASASGTTASGTHLVANAASQSVVGGWVWSVVLGVVGLYL